MADGFVWIEAISYEENYNFIPFVVNSFCYRIPVLDERFLGLLPRNRISVTLTIGSSEESSPCQTIRKCVFPYQCESMLRFVVEWRQWWQGAFLSVQVSFNSHSMTSITGRMLSQAREIIQLLRFSCRSQSRFDLSSGASTALITPFNFNFSGASALEDCQSVLARVRQLDASGMKHEADVFACLYYYQLSSHVREALQNEGLIMHERLAVRIGGRTNNVRLLCYFNCNT